MQVRRCHVIEHRVGVGVEHRAEESPYGKAEVEHPQSADMADYEEWNGSEEESGSLKQHSVFRGACREPVRKRTGEEYAYECRDISPEHRVESCRCLAEPAFVLKICRHPGHITGNHEDESGEPEGEAGCGRVCENCFETVQYARLVSLSGLFLLIVERFVLEPERHEYSPNDAGRTEEDEGVFPSLSGVQRIEPVGNQSGEPSRQNYTYIICRLMNRHCPCTGVRVILPEQRIVGGAEKRLSSSRCYAAHKHEHEYAVSHSCEHSRRAPEED